LEAFLPIGVLLILGLVVAGAILALTTILGPNNPLPIKLMPYECGIKTQETARRPFKNRFYLIAVLFLLFDVEAAFFFPWALVYKDSLAQGPDLLIAILIYIGLLTLGLVYIIRKKCLELV